MGLEPMLVDSYIEVALSQHNAIKVFTFVQPRGEAVVGWQFIVYHIQLSKTTENARFSRFGIECVHFSY